MLVDRFTSPQRTCSGRNVSRKLLSNLEQFNQQPGYKHRLSRLVASKFQYDFCVQNKIGADIIMALDDVVKTTTTGPRVEEAMHRTLRWIDRCIAGSTLSTLALSLIEDVRLFYRSM